MNLFEEGWFAISLLLQLVDGSLLMFVIFSLSAARGEAGPAPTLHLSQVSLVLEPPTGACTEQGLDTQKQIHDS